MCRMISFAATREGISNVTMLVEGLVESSREDPYSKPLTKDTSHGDGWGYAIAYERGGYLYLEHYKTLNPIFEDVHGVGKLLGTLNRSEKVWGVAHSRKASRNEPKSIIDTHPFHGVTIDGVEFYLAHNGTIKKDRMKGYREVMERCDSLILTLYLSRILLEDFPEEFKKLACREYLKSALNLGLLILTFKNQPYVQTFTYNIFDDEDRELYYRQYLVGDGSFYAVTSSTITDYYVTIFDKVEVPKGRNCKISLKHGEVTYSIF